MDSSDLHFARPADNGNLAGIVANGVQGGNEFTIDGAPNMSNARGVGLLAAVGRDRAVQGADQRVRRADAATRPAPSSTWRSRAGPTRCTCAGQLLQPRRQPLGDAAADRARQRHQADARVQPLHRHAERADRPEPDVLHGVVRAPARRAARAGDLHRADREDARAATSASSRTQIFDPHATVTSGGARTPFAEQPDPGRAGSTRWRRPTRRSIRCRTVRARSATTSPTSCGPTTTTPGMGRVDHNFTAANRLFVTDYWNKRQEDRYNWAQDASNATDGGVINGFAITKGFDYRSNTGVTGGYTSALSSTAPARRPRQLVAVRRVSRSGADFDPASLGFSPAALQLMGGLQLPAADDLRQLQHDERELDDRVARLAALRLGRRLQPADGHLLGRADADARCGATTRVARRLRPAHQELGRSPTTASRAGASSSTAPTRARTTPRRSTIARSRGRSSCSGCRRRRPARWRRRARTSSQFEIASPGEFTQMYHGLFVQDDWRVSAEADAESGAAPRDQLRHDAKSDDRNLAGFDTVDVEPDRGRGAWPPTRRTRFPRFPVGASRSRAACCSPTARSTRPMTKLLPRGALLVPARRAHGPARRRRPVLVRLLLREHQPGRLLAGDAGARRRNDNGLTFTGATLTESDSERPADAAGRRRAGPAQPARPEPRHAVPARSRRRRTTRAGKRACSATGATAG